MPQAPTHDQVQFSPLCNSVPLKNGILLVITDLTKKGNFSS